MAAIARKTQKVFGGNLAANLNVAKFGSLAAGSPAYSLDLALIQTTEWLNGWAAAVTGNNSPALQDFNAAFLVFSQQLAYLLQSGVAEWDAGTTYWTGQFVRGAGSGNLFRSLVDNNLNHAVTDATKWEAFLPAPPTHYPISVANSSQNVAVDGAGHKVDFDTVVLDPDSAFNAGTNKFTAEVDGIYEFSAYLQVDNDDADEATLEISLRLVKNGAAAVQANGTSVANPPGQRWYPTVMGLVELSAGDTIEVQFSANDMPGGGHVDLSNGNLSGKLIQAT